MIRRGPYFIALLLASVIGSAMIMLAGGGAALVDALLSTEQHATRLAIVFAAWALVANCLVLPAGSLSLIAGGAALGTLVPAAIWFVAQLITAPLLYRAGHLDRGHVEGIMRRYLGATAADLVVNAARDGIWTTAVLRLTPVLPSAPATLIAAATGIRFRSFVWGSLLVGWVRPLYFASLGASFGSLARFGTAKTILTFELLWPLAVVCACAAAMLGARLLIARRRTTVPADRAPAPAD